MSRHFPFVVKLQDLSRRQEVFRSESELEEDRLLICSGLMKCADISNPVRSISCRKRRYADLLELDSSARCCQRMVYSIVRRVVSSSSHRGGVQATGLGHDLESLRSESASEEPGWLYQFIHRSSFRRCRIKLARYVFISTSTLSSAD